MNAVTCQASAYRYTLTPARAGAGAPPAAGTASFAAGAVPEVRYLSWGSHSSTASAAGSAPPPGVSRTEPPQLRDNGPPDNADRPPPPGRGGREKPGGTPAPSRPRP